MSYKLKRFLSDKYKLSKSVHIYHLSVCLATGSEGAGSILEIIASPLSDLRDD